MLGRKKRDVAENQARPGLARELLYEGELSLDELMLEKESASEYLEGLTKRIKQAETASKPAPLITLDDETRNKLIWIIDNYAKLGKQLELILDGMITLELYVKDVKKALGIAVKDEKETKKEEGQEAGV